MYVYRIKGNGLSLSITVPESLKEVTVKKYIEFNDSILSNIPQSFVDYQNAADEKRIDVIKKYEAEASVQTQWIKYLRSAVAFWSGTPEENLNALPLEHFYAIYTHIEKALISQPLEADISEFTLKGSTYYVADVELKKETLGAFIEALQYEHYHRQLSNTSLHHLPYLLGIICRKKDEKYMEGLEEQRKALFEELDMFTAWQVAFFFARRRLGLIQDSLSYSSQDKGQLKPQLKERRGGNYLRTSAITHYLKKLGKAVLSVTRQKKPIMRTV